MFVNRDAWINIALVFFVYPDLPITTITAPISGFDNIISYFPVIRLGLLSSPASLILALLFFYHDINNTSLEGGIYFSCSWTEDDKRPDN